MLARTETEGGPEGPPFSSIHRRTRLTKPFLTYQQQVEKLIYDKHLIIPDQEYAIRKLQEIGYFTLIGGYKKPFQNTMTRIYKTSTTFEDIYALYQFDNQLRDTIFQYICQIERKLRSLVSYAFCEEYGELQEKYLTPNNYNYTRKNQRGVDKLIRILYRLANENVDYDYIVYQRKVYNNIPLWVLINAITIGQLSKMYSFLTPKIKSKISRHFIHVNERELEQYLKVLVLYRNVFAHNERLFSHKVYSEIPNTVLHQKLRIPQIGTQYIYGKKDLFSVIIAFRYLLSKEDFLVLKRTISGHIDRYIKHSGRINEIQLLDYMGFPQNWENITKYKL